VKVNSVPLRVWLERAERFDKELTMSGHGKGHGKGTKKGGRKGGKK
jgi:hypothetical protein